MNAQSTIRSLTVIVATLIPILLVAAATYLLFTHARESFLVDRDYRALLTMSRQIQTRLDNLREAVGTEHRSRAASYVTPSMPCLGDAVPLAEAPWIKRVRRAKVKMSAAAEGGTRLGVTMAADQRTIDGYIAFDSRCDEVAGVGAVPGPNCGTSNATCTTRVEKTGRYRTCSRIPLDRLLREITGVDTVFDAIAVSIGDEVIVLGDAAPANVADDLVRELQGGGSAQAETPSDPDVARAEQQLKPRHIPSLAVHGEKFLRFSLPITAPAAAPRPDGTLADAPLRIHGLVREATFKQQVRRVSDASILVSLVLLVFAVLAWPLLKVGYMGATERLNGLDIRVLVLSMVLLTAIVVVGIFEVARHRAMSEAFDDQLEWFARDVAGALRTDLEHAVRVAQSLGESGPPGPLDYRDFEVVVAIGADARAVKAWKATAPSDGVSPRLVVVNTPNLRVDDRQYYTDVKSGRVWKMEVDGASVDLVAEVVPSKISSAPALALALPLDRAASERVTGLSDATALVVAMRATALLGATLPHGFGFAFLDSTGRVMLHSDVHRVLVENFVKECADNPWLQAVLHAPPDAPFDLECSGTLQRAKARTIEELPWTLVVFQDRRVLDKVNDDLIGAWALLFLIYVAGLLVALLAAQIVHDGYRAEWLWPDRHCPWIYAPATVRLLATAVVASVALGHQNGPARLWFLYATVAATIAALAISLSTPRGQRAPLGPRERWVMRGLLVAGVGLLAWLVRDWGSIVALVLLAVLWLPNDGSRPSRVQLATLPALGVLTWMMTDGGPVADWADVGGRYGALALMIALPMLAGGRWRRVAGGDAAAPTEARFRFEYVGMLFALLAVLAIVPSVALYRDARLQALTELLRFGRWQKTADASAVASASPRPSGGERKVYRTAWNCWDDSVLLGTSANGGDGGPRSLARFAVSQLPMFGSPIAELRALGERRGDDALTCPSRACRGPSWSAPPPSSTVVLVSLGFAAFVVLFSVMWSLARLVFLLDIDRFTGKGSFRSTDRGALSAWTFGTRDGLIALTTSPPPPPPPPAPPPPSPVIDLRIPTTADELRAQAKALASTAPPFIEIDHSEAILDDLALHPALLDVLERLVHDGKTPVILISEVDPIYWTASRALEAAGDLAAAAQGDDAKKADEVKQRFDGLLARWSQVLGTFTRTRWEVPPGATVKDETQRHIADALAAKYPRLDPGAATEELGELYEARHWQIWRQCTRAEKLSLRQLAEEGFLNPNAIGIARGLSDRLLIRRDPAFSLVTDAFGRFVLRAETPQTIAQWEAAGAQSWARLRVPLMMVAAIAAAYFIVAEPGALNSTIAIATGVAALLPAILKLFSSFGDQRFAAGGR